MRLIRHSFCAVFSAALSVSVLWAGADTRSALETRWLQEIDPEYKPVLIGAVSHPPGGVLWKDASGGVNGDRYDEIGFHTLEEARPWWVVDLGKVYRIGRIVLYNRKGAENRDRFIEVLLSSDAVSWDEIYTHNGQTFHGGVEGTTPLTVTVGGHEARYVRLQVRNTFLHLNEVEVFAAGDDTTNLALRRPATQSSSGPWSKSSLEKPVKLEIDIPPAPTPEKAERRVTASAQHVEDTVALTRRTIGYVEASGVSCRDVTEEFESLCRRAAASDLSDQARTRVYLDLRHLRRKTLFRHPDLAFETILINQAPAPAYSHNGDQHLAAVYCGRGFSPLLGSCLP